MPRNWHIPGQAPGTPPKGGRPSKGDRVEIKARLPRSAAEQIRALAAEAGEAPCETVTRLVLAALYPGT